MGFFKFNPAWQLDRLSREMDKVTSHFSNPFPMRVQTGNFQPIVDIYEDENRIYFDAEIPGLNKSDVKITINNENEVQILSISGEKKFEKKEEVKTCCRSERLYGQFKRSYALPENADAENIKAKFEDGLLKIQIPKIRPVEPEEKTIDID